ncbi:stage II sporulation protein P [Thermaerobacter subterraneus DSM 13965]|uniref:Stage II sporulation protein P n=1 Tax=Thermaerobacter subterraneus DSM 13965 TaxID=867903 RepID=K6QDX4_9FIRM|nr:stage II sporulation protein P [Thermaerobacter subterraneus DSM 13965]
MSVNRPPGHGTPGAPAPAARPFGDPSLPPTAGRSQPDRARASHRDEPAGGPALERASGGYAPPAGGGPSTARGAGGGPAVGGDREAGRAAGDDAVPPPGEAAGGSASRAAPPPGLQPGDGTGPLAPAPVPPALGRPAGGRRRPSPGAVVPDRSRPAVPSRTGAREAVAAAEPGAATGPGVPPGSGRPGMHPAAAGTRRPGERAARPVPAGGVRAVSTRGEDASRRTGAAGTRDPGAPDAAGPRGGPPGAQEETGAGSSGDGGARDDSGPGGPPGRPGPARKDGARPQGGGGRPDAWSLVATYAGLVVAVFLFLAGLGGGLPWDRAEAPARLAGGGAFTAPARPGQDLEEPAVPALSGGGRAPQPGQEDGPLAGGADDTALGAAGGAAPGGGDGAGPGAAGGEASGGGDSGAPAAGGSGEEPDLWQALGERLWGWRAVLRAVWPGSPAGEGEGAGDAGAGAGDAGQLGRRLAYLLVEKASGVRLDEPLTLVAAQFPGEHHLELFEEEGGPVVGRLAPPDVLAGGLPRFRPPAPAQDGGEVAVTGDRPRVLIYHTHTSEAYVGAVPAGAGFDPAVEAFTSDPGASVVGAGAVIQQVLEEHGIGAVHLRQVFDRDGQRVTRIGNYQRSLAALAGSKEEPGLLDRYPTVDVVLDVHRDGIPRDSTLVKVGGRPAAGILFVVGTDRRLEHPHWKKNFCFVQWIVAELNARYPGLVKGVLLSDNRYNQHVRPGAVLVEIGGYGNTPEEADRSARMFAEALAAVIEAGKVPQADRPFQCPPGVAPPR